MKMITRIHAGPAAAALAAMAMVSSAWGQAPAPPAPGTTFNGQSPVTAASPSPGNFPELKQDAAGNWLVGFEHLASFSFGRHKVDYEDTLKPKGLGAKRLALLIGDTRDPVEMPTEPGQSGTIPARILALEGKKVRVSGYMLPIKLENGLVTQCLLLRNQMMCCYGRQPELNEWVVVTMKGKGVPSTMDTVLAFYGTLHVGEIFENHIFEGLYQLDCEKISIQ